MDSVLCSVCGREMADEAGIYTCLSCGGIVCSDDYEDMSGICMNCSKNGCYNSEC